MLTVRQAAERLGLAESTLRNWIAERRIEVVKLGRAVRILPEEVARIIEQGKRSTRPVRKGTRDA
jgi:excisionase family DNA binding protein